MTPLPNPQHCIQDERFTLWLFANGCLSPETTWHVLEEIGDRYEQAFAPVYRAFASLMDEVGLFELRK